MAKILSQSCLIISSASIAVLTFILPQYCAEGTFIFLVPLFLLVCTTKNYGFKTGFLWGILFYSFYFIGVTHLILEKGGGEYRWVAPLVLIIYGACCSGIWFWCSNFLCKKCNSNDVVMKISCFVGATLLYYWWVNFGFFSLFGCFEGNQLQHPLLPLMIRIAWMRAVALWPHGLGMVWLVCMQACCALVVLKHQRTVALVLAVLFFIPFAAGWWLPDVSRRPLMLDTIGCIIPRSEYEDPWQAQEHLAELFASFAHDALITCIILPESSFAFPLNYWQRAVNVWYENLGNDDLYVVLGSHRKEREELYNSWYVLHQRRIIHYYDKTHRMFFTEHLPLWWSTATTKKLFLENKMPFTQGKRKKEPFFLPDFFCIPYMCSELFFEPVGIMPSCKAEILICLVNDSWFANGYIPQLLYLYARYKALVIKKDILYVSYRYAACITGEGKVYTLKRVQAP